MKMINIVFLTLKRKSSFSLTTAIKLAEIIDSNSIDIIHLHWTKDLPIVVLAKVFFKKKTKSYSIKTYDND